MATHTKAKLSHEEGTELCRVRKKGIVKGFRKDISTENLSERDYAFLTCSRCDGILREACNSGTGEQFCLCCKKGRELTHPIIQVRVTVSDLKSSCPINQRGCTWKGNLGECEKHLEMCSYVHEACKLGCGVVLSRDELRIHLSESCDRREIQCMHCEKATIVVELTDHLLVCEKMVVPCELGCSKLMIRENMTQHMDIECEEKEVDCPFVKYSCKVGLIKKKELNQHLEDTKIEHMEMKVNSLEEMVVKQNEIISQLSQKMENMIDPKRYNMVVWNVEGITVILVRNKNHTFISGEYLFCGFPMTFNLTVSKSITIEFHIENRRSILPLYPQSGRFITRLICHSDKESTLEFKSRHYVMEQPVTGLTGIKELFYNTRGEIATFYRDRIVAKFIRDGGIEFEITFERS